MTELVLLLILLSGVVSVVWHSLRTGISPMPSSRKAQEAILSLIHVQQDDVIIDAGSGWGGVAINAAKRFPDARVIGYELSPLPWLISRIRQKLFGIENLMFYRQDYRNEDLSCAAFIICYLFPDGMKILREKLQREKNFSGEIISNTFALRGYHPEKVIRLNDLSRTPIYLYHLTD